MSETKEFVVRDHTYSSTKLSAFKQLHLSRKAAPLYIGADGMFSAGMLPALSNISQEDLDDMLLVVLPVVVRKLDDKGWAPIYHAETHTILYPDINGPDLLAILINVIDLYLPDFINALVPKESSTESLIQDMPA